jgi:hypothetical protein
MKGNSLGIRAAYSSKAWVAPCLLVIATPALVSAAGADAHPRFGPILFSLAVLVVSAKVGGLLAERWHQPPVLGELLAGIALANLLPLFFEAERLAFIRADRTLRVLAEVGVLILLFDVGLEADLRALARVGTSSVLVALIGVLVPIGLGSSAARWLLPASPMVVHLRCGLRQSGDMGVARIHLHRLLTAIALNVVRLGAWWRGTCPVKTRCSSFAVLRGAVT